MITKLIITTFLIIYNPVNWTQIITGLVSAIAGLIGGYFTFRGNKDNSFREDFKEVVDRLQLDIKKLSERETGYVNKIKDLETQVGILKNQLNLSQSLHLNIPVPQWVKDNSGKMLALNSAYEDIFLEPLGINAYDVIGNIDKIEIDSESTDKEVIRTNQVWKGIKNISRGSYEEPWYVIKYPLNYNGLTVGIGELAYESVSQVEHIKNKIDKND